MQSRKRDTSQPHPNIRPSVRQLSCHLQSITRIPQQMTQHCFPLTSSSGNFCHLVPSRISMLARVAASKTSSTPSLLRALHSLYARAPISAAIRCARSLLTNSLKFGEPDGGRRSALQPTRITGTVRPQIDRTSSIHCGWIGVRNQRGRTEQLTKSHFDRYIFQRVRSVDGKCNKNNM